MSQVATLLNPHYPASLLVPTFRPIKTIGQYIHDKKNRSATACQSHLPCLTKSFCNPRPAMIVHFGESTAQNHVMHPHKIKLTRFGLMLDAFRPKFGRGDRSLRPAVNTSVGTNTDLKVAFDRRGTYASHIHVVPI